MPTASGQGFVDYVLWGDDGKPLGLVEAKRTRRDAQAGRQQAKLYADCLEKQSGQRPVIFYTNGYEHWIWDDAQYPPRKVSGFYTKAELALLIQRRTSRGPLAAVATDKAIAERYYQERAIRNIAKAFEEHHQRKALLVMATGAGKTRTVPSQKASDWISCNRASWAATMGIAAFSSSKEAMPITCPFSVSNPGSPRSRVSCRRSIRRSNCLAS